MYRHGDILLARVDQLPGEVRKLQHLVLAEGELTGHSHRIQERDVAVLFRSEAGMFLQVTGARATLVHQEHGPIELETGYYRVWRQREYSPKEIRVIRD
jgi:hypothetical protein